MNDYKILWGYSLNELAGSVNRALEMPGGYICVGGILRTGTKERSTYNDDNTIRYYQAVAKLTINLKV